MSNGLNQTAAAAGAQAAAARRSVAAHMTAVLAEEKALATEDLPLDHVAAITHFGSELFDLPRMVGYLENCLGNRVERKKAFVALLHKYHFSEELLGVVGDDGRHTQGPLEACFRDQPEEFLELMAVSGRQALRRGHYVEALRLLHLGEKPDEVLVCLQRLLRLPIWENEDSGSPVVRRLEGEVNRFLRIYEVKSGSGSVGSTEDVDMTGLGGLGVPQGCSAPQWHLLQRLAHVRDFFRLARQQQTDVAIRIFEEFNLLAPVDTGGLASALCPPDYNRILEVYLEMLSRQPRPSLLKLQDLRLLLARSDHIFVSSYAQSLLTHAFAKTS